MSYTDRQLREVFHFIFLERLLKISDPGLYVLKGGVNLRFFMNSPRLSEDMDLDVLAGSTATLEKNCYKILNDAAFTRSLSTYGIEELRLNNPSSAKQTETTQRFRLRLITAAAESLPTKIEFSRRKIGKARTGLATEIISPAIAEIYGRLSFLAGHYSGDEAAIQKVRALGSRRETQARDVFDLYILYLGGHAKKEKIHSSCTNLELSRAASALASLDYDAYRGQVVEYLEDEASGMYSSSGAWDKLCDVVLGLLL